MNQKIISPQLPKLDFRSNEAINILRGNIQMAGYKIKTIAFSSANANEGKTSISFRLSKSLAGIKKKTLFLDCDIRNSSVKHSYHITEKTYGLSEYLCGQSHMEDIIYPADDPYLDIIFAGKTAPNPSELLSEDLFSNLIAALREQYDYVILDTPPVNIVIDATLIAQKCDAAILIVRGFHTDRRDANHMQKQLENAGIKIMGVVINQVDDEKSHYGKYGYGKYGKYGYGKYGYKKVYGDYAKAAEKSKESEK